MRVLLSIVVGSIAGLVLAGSVFALRKGVNLSPSAASVHPLFASATGTPLPEELRGTPLFLGRAQTEFDSAILLDSWLAGRYFVTYDRDVGICLIRVLAIGDDGPNASRTCLSAAEFERHPLLLASGVGRDADLVGVAHPCYDALSLADGQRVAIRDGTGFFRLELDGYVHDVSAVMEGQCEARSITLPTGFVSRSGTGSD